MKLSIVTINYNDAPGLQRTLDSVASQTILSSASSSPFPFSLEHIIIDGASTDGSVDIIRNYEVQFASVSSFSLKWLSEPDSGVYNAMNKGIRLATGDYIQILNSGDILAAPDVLSSMFDALQKANRQAHQHAVTNTQSSTPEIININCVDIIYGNMLKAMPDGKLVRDNCGGPGVGSSFLYFYRGTLNHDCAWIKRSLFDRYGLYDEEMKICSDWKWYVDAIALGGVKPVYVDIDVTIFDMNGISESGGKNKVIIQKERRDYLEQILPTSVLADYDKYAFPISQYERLKKYHLWGMVNFVERVLFKLKKWGVLK